MVFIGTLKMPHNNFKERSHLFNSGVGKCSCSQTFDYISERDRDMKLRMHRKFCPKLAEGSKQIRRPNKTMTLKERQHNYVKRMRRVHENN